LNLVREHYAEHPRVIRKRPDRRPTVINSLV
jgi:hypothetical protein